MHGGRLNGANRYTVTFAKGEAPPVNGFWVATVILAAAFASAAGLAKAQVIKIAVVGPITGSNAVGGERMRRGAEMAVKDINAKGGVLAKRLDLIVADDACDRE